MGQDPDAIREDIEQTRAEMSETVEAIGYKADVPSRAKDAVSDKVENVKSKVSDTATRAKEAVTGTTSQVSDRVVDATPSSGQVKQQARRTAGLAVPSTQVEDEKLGPMADQVKDKLKETGQEAMDRGKQVAQEVASSAADTAKQATQEHGQELADSAKQNAQDLGDQASRTGRSQTAGARTRRARNKPPRP